MKPLPLHYWNFPRPLSLSDSELAAACEAAEAEATNGFGGCPL